MLVGVAITGVVTFGSGGTFAGAEARVLDGVVPGGIANRCTIVAEAVDISGCCGAAVLAMGIATDAGAGDKRAGGFC